MRKVLSLLVTLLLVTTILSSIYDVVINDSVYAQLYFQPLEEQQPLDIFNNQPVNTINNQPPQVELLHHNRHP